MGLDVCHLYSAGVAQLDRAQENYELYLEKGINSNQFDRGASLDVVGSSPTARF